MLPKDSQLKHQWHRLKERRDQQYYISSGFRIHKFLDVLKHINSNICLIEALQHMPNYEMFLKDIITKRRRIGEFENVALTKKCNMWKSILLCYKILEVSRLNAPQVESIVKNLIVTWELASIWFPNPISSSLG